MSSSSETPTKPELFKRYPFSALAIYNGVTFLHFLLGGLGIILGYNSSTIAYLLGIAYLIFAFGQMYVLMPLVVCPNCPYYRMEDSLCVSGMNVVAQKIAKEGKAEDFPKRAQGLLCHNNLYMASLFAPIIVMIPGLIANFSFLLLVIFLAVVGLLLYRFFVVFPRKACIHCYAKYKCPNAIQMGLDKT